MKANKFFTELKFVGISFGIFWLLWLVVGLINHLSGGPWGLLVIPILIGILFIYLWMKLWKEIEKLAEMQLQSQTHKSLEDDSQ